jgi:hypothetical protein
LPDALVISEDHVGELGEDLLVSRHLWKSRDFIYTFLLGDFFRPNPALKGAAIGGIQQTLSRWSDSEKIVRKVFALALKFKHVYHILYIPPVWFAPYMKLI